MFAYIQAPGHYSVRRYIKVATLKYHSYYASLHACYHVCVVNHNDFKYLDILISYNRYHSKLAISNAIIVLYQPHILAHIFAPYFASYLRCTYIFNRCLYIQQVLEFFYQPPKIKMLQIRNLLVNYLTFRNLIQEDSLNHYLSIHPIRINQSAIKTAFLSYTKKSKVLNTLDFFVSILANFQATNCLIYCQMWPTNCLFQRKILLIFYEIHTKFQQKL